MIFTVPYLEGVLDLEFLRFLSRSFISFTASLLAQEFIISVLNDSLFLPRRCLRVHLTRFVLPTSGLATSNPYNPTSTYSRPSEVISVIKLTLQKMLGINNI